MEQKPIADEVISNFFEKVGINLTGEKDPDIEELSKLLAQGDTVLQHFVLEDGEYRLVVKMINTSTNPIPTYGKYGDSGFDLRANLPEGPVTIPAGKIALIPTGNFFQVPHGWEMQVRSRSGYALKEGVMVLNSPGTVDSNYRGEVKAILFNTGAYGDVVINHGDRVCQAVISNVVLNVKLVPSEELDETERGSAGFGSSGKQ